MVIRKIALRNYRRFVEEEVTFGIKPGINLIVGMSKSGKSTIVEALRWGLCKDYRICKGRDSIVNSQVLKKTKIGDSICVSTEILLMIGNSDYKVIKCMMGKREKRNKFNFEKIDYIVLLRQTDGTYTETRIKCIFPLEYDQFIFFDETVMTPSISDLKDRRFLLNAIPGFSDSREIIDCCELAEQKIKRMIPDSGRLKSLENEETKITEKITVLEEQRKNVLSDIEYCEQIISKAKGKMIYWLPPRMTEENYKWLTDKFSKKFVDNYLESLKIKRIKEEQLREIMNEKTKLEERLDRIRQMNSYICKDNNKTDRLAETLKYIAALKKWYKRSYDAMKESGMEQIEQYYLKVLGDMGFKDYDTYGVFSSYDIKAYWKRVIIDLARMIACRRSCFIERESIYHSPPMIIDIDFDCFGEAEAKKIIRYLSTLHEQLIITKSSEKWPFDIDESFVESKHTLCMDGQM